METGRSLSNGMTWWDGKGFGFYPVSPQGVYGKEYFDRYVLQSKSSIGASLTRARIDLVEKYAGSDPIVDIGIGSGQFIQARGLNTFGYDVNPIAIRWLLDKGLWFDPYFINPQHASTWDSLEHMRVPSEFVGRIREILFISIPIFIDADHAMRSKHFRPDEHYWYFTRDGLVTWMGHQGFRLLEENKMETKIGREDIGSFVFKRRDIC